MTVFGPDFSAFLTGCRAQSSLVFGTIMPIGDPSAPAEAVETAFDVAGVFLGIVVGILVGIVVAFILARVSRFALRKLRLLKALQRRIHAPSYWALMAWGALAGCAVALGSTDVSNQPTWVKYLDHGLLILALLATTWVIAAAVWVIEDAAHVRNRSDHGRSRRFKTQAQVLRRVLQVVVWILGFAAVLFTFPGAQQALTTVLASAGIVSVIAGLAAQSTLGNVFAGLQLAFTDAIRVDDIVVVVGDKETMGVVEEITLTYVVLHIWDDRRLIVPSSKFTSSAFENWTRKATKLLGTVEIYTDWAVPVAVVRQKVEQLLNSTDLWDRRSWAVQVTDSTDQTVTVRVSLSASNSGNLWDLRCFMREQLIAWISKEYPWARPARIIQPREIKEVTKDESQELIARLATELSGIAGSDTSGGSPLDNKIDEGDHGDAATHDGDKRDPFDPVHAARMLAARQRAKMARRRAMSQRNRDRLERAENAEARAEDDPAAAAKRTGRGGADAAGDAAHANGTGTTHVFTPEEVDKIIAQAQGHLRVKSDAGSGAPGQANQASEAASAEGAAQIARSASGVAETAVMPAIGADGKPKKQADDDGAEAGSSAPTSGAQAGDASSARADNTSVDLASANQVGSDPDGAVADATGRANSDDETTTTGERVFSGSPDAEERSAAFSGPDPEVLEERKRESQIRQEKGSGLLGGSSRE